MRRLGAAHRELLDWLMEAYALWWAQGADHANGGFHERLTLRGTPTPDPRRVRVQARQVYAYSRAPALGWDGPAAEAALHGLGWLSSHFRRPDGLYRSIVEPDGSPLDEGPLLYDQAFVLLALASGFELLDDRELSRRATELHDCLSARLAWQHGGFRESDSRSLPLSSNSHMHLFEASLAWCELDGDPRWSRLAAQIAELALARFIDSESGALREFFVDDWLPAPGEAGRRIEPGHQFEWGWLLLRFAARTCDERARQAAFRLIEIGEAYGVDPARGVAVNALRGDLSVLDTEARLWPQTERLKAACLAAGESDGAHHVATAAQAVEALLAYLATPVRGLWRDRMRRGGDFTVEPAPASSFYHLVGAIAELDALCRRVV